MSNTKPCVHFVGFRDDNFNRAVRVFGRPDFIHHDWDRWAMGDVAPGDVVVCARDEDWQRFVENRPTQYAYNDSLYF